MRRKYAWFITKRLAKKSLNGKSAAISGNMITSTKSHSNFTMMKATKKVQKFFLTIRTLPFVLDVYLLHVIIQGGYLYFNFSRKVRAMRF